MDPFTLLASGAAAVWDGQMCWTSCTYVIPTLGKKANESDCHSDDGSERQYQGETAHLPGRLLNGDAEVNYLEDEADVHENQLVCPHPSTHHHCHILVLMNICLTTLGGSPAAVVAAPAILAGVGFTSAGIAAGSVASAMMSAAATAGGGG